MTTAIAPVDPYRTHIAALGAVATVAVPDGDDPDLTEALELLDMLGITADGALRPDDTSSIVIPGMGGKAPGQDTPPSARTNNAFARADEPRGLPTSPPGLRDYDATEPAKPRVRPAKVAAPKPPPKKRAPRTRKAPAPPPVKAFDTAPIPGLDIRPRMTRMKCTVEPVYDTPAPQPPAVRTSTTSTPSARPAGAKRRTGPRLKPIVHGTPNGYSTHYRRKEKPCDECKDAWNAMTRAKKRDRKKHQAIVKARRGAADIATELDVWFAEAQRSTDQRVTQAAAVGISALMALRIAVDDLARAERHAVAAADEQASA